MFELGTDGPRQILVGIDGSDSSMRAGSYAAGLARRQSAELLVLHVTSTGSSSAAMAATAGIAIPQDDTPVQELERLVQEGAAHVGVPVVFVRRFGNPYQELVALAAELRIDAIVVGASQSAGHRVIGSLAGRLVRNGRWPVTVVP